MSDLPPVPEPVPPAPGLPPAEPAPVGPDGLPERPDRSTPLATWTWWEAVLAYLILTYVVGSVVSIPVLLLMSRGTGPSDGFDPTGAGLIVASIVIDLVLAGGLVLWLNRAHPTWKRVMGFPKTTAALSKEMAAGFIAALAILVVAGIVGSIVQAIVSALAGRDLVVPDQLPDDLSGVGNVVTVVFVCVVAPIVEEFYFRGVLFRSIRDRYGAVLGVVASGLLFGLVHVGVDGGSLTSNLLLQIPLAVVGMGFAIVYERRRNLAAPIAAHMMFNIIGIITLFFFT
ncbi:MAG: CPBP family intramembrane glutamic endopeptidase [Actinomycetota bacterium]